MLAHAINRTNITVVMRSRITARSESLSRASSSDTTFAVHPALLFGYFSDCVLAIASMFARACCKVAPFFKFPKVIRKREDRDAVESARSGNQRELSAR